MQILKADTAVDVRIGPCVDATDGVTPETGITLGAADQAELLKHDGAATVDISGNTFAAVTSCDGWYDLTITAAQLDTEGMLTVVIQDSSVMLPVFKDFMVANANVYDSLYAAATTDYLQVDSIQISGSADAADRLEEGAKAIIPGTCDGTPSATSITTTLESAESLTTDDALIGRVIIFDGNTTAALKAQAATITDYTGASGTITLAASAITTAPVSGDTFQIV